MDDPTPNRGSKTEHNTQRQETIKKNKQKKQEVTNMEARTKTRGLDTMTADQKTC